MKAEADQARKAVRPSLATVVLQTRRYRRQAIYALVLTGVAITSTYLLLVWPIFQPHDLSNPEVQRFLLSDDFRSRTAPVFEQVKRYNARAAGERVEVPPELYAGSGSMSGLQVTVHYRLVRDASTTRDAAGNSQLVYLPDIAIRLDPRYLVGYLLSMVVLGVCIHGVGRRPEKAQWLFEERLLEHAFPLDLVRSEGSDDRSDKLLALLGRFHVFTQQLGIRHGSRPAMAFDDEYDVQDALHALLKLHYLVVRDEEYTPSYAGNSSRMDFLLDDEAIAVEVKMTRAGLHDKEVANELIIDAARYRSHPKVKHLVCLIYDPARLLKNPELLKRDLEPGDAVMRVSVVIVP